MLPIQCQSNVRYYWSVLDKTCYSTLNIIFLVTIETPVLYEQRKHGTYVFVLLLRAHDHFLANEFWSLV